MGINGKDKQDVFDEYFNSKNAVIIDGVDVSECEFYEPKAQVMQCHRGAITQRCKENNCHFKQFQRLKAENEDLKFYIDSYRQTWELDKYKKALENIREIVLAECKFCGRNITDRCALCYTNTVLSKTNEVLIDVRN